MVAILLGTGFEPLEMVGPCDILRRGGLDVRLAAVGPDKVVEAGHGIRFVADCTLEELNAGEIELLMLPGGLGGVQSVLASEQAMALVEQVWRDGKFVTAICAAPTILAKLGITDGKKAVCYPGCEVDMGAALMQDADAIRDGRIITGRAAGAAMDFGLLLLEALKGEGAARQIKDQIVYCH